MKKSRTFLSAYSRSRGFSLTELIIAIAIFVLLSATLAFNYNTYSGKMVIGNAANQLALDTREAQANAMGVKVTAGGKYPSYGIRFARANPNTYLIYADLNQDKVYNAGGTCGTAASECVKTITMPQKIRITSLCGRKSVVNSTADCPNPLSTSQYFDILFTRPNASATITGNPGAGPVVYTTAEVTMTATKGYTKKVIIASTGQVTVQ